MSKSWRKIHIDNEIWTYKIGGKKGGQPPYNILIKDPTGKKHVAKTTDVMGMNNDFIERGYWKGWLHITPEYIKIYIINCVLKKGDLFKKIIGQKNGT